MLHILHKNEVGTSLEFTDENKFEVKPDNSGNVQFEVTKAGLKGNVQLPDEFDSSILEGQIQVLQTQLAEAQSKLNELQTEKEALKTKVQALENRKDLHATGLTLDEITNEVVLTVEGGSELRVGLGKFLNIVPTADEIYAEIKDTIINDITEVLKGEVVQDFAGNVKGYLFK